MTRRQRRDHRARTALRPAQDPTAAYLQARRAELLRELSDLPSVIRGRHRPFGYAMLAVAIGNLVTANRFAGRVLP